MNLLSIRTSYVHCFAKWNIDSIDSNYLRYHKEIIRFLFNPYFKFIPICKAVSFLFFISSTILFRKKHLLLKLHLWVGNWNFTNDTSSLAFRFWECTFLILSWNPKLFMCVFKNRLRRYTTILHLNYIGRTLWRRIV